MFLAELFHSGLESSTIAGYRFSISAYMTLLIVFCFLVGGVFNDRAPVPRHAFVWDVQNLIACSATLSMVGYLRC